MNWMPRTFRRTGRCGPGPIRQLHADQRGQATVEWMLILVAFSLPMLWVIRKLLAVLADHYRMVSFLETLPFP
jgi:Flp pilus assembly pilin Flp